jgi:hypothetical protein
MAKFAATDYLVTINGGTVSANLNSVELAQESDDIETTAFQKYLDSLSNVGRDFDEFKTNLISRFLITDAIKEFDTEDRKTFRFKPLTDISGRKLTVWFKYEEESVETADKLQMTIVKSDDETEIKDFILSEINNYIN